MKSSLKNFLIISVPTFVFLFFLLEGVVRIFYDHVDIYEYTGRIETYLPMKKWAANSSFSSYSAIPGNYSEGKSVNSDGFISTPEINTHKENNTLRIVFLGGSSTAGTGKNLDDELTWPWSTTSRLHTAHFNVDFINAALGGFSTFESYGILWSKLRFYKPDIVILNHGWNEMYYFNEVADNPENFKNDFSLNKKYKIERIAPKKIDSYIRWSQLLTKIRIVITNYRNANGELSKTNAKSTLQKNFNKKGLDIFRGNLRLIKSFCTDNNIQLFVCKQPTLITDSTSADDKLRCGYANHGFDHAAHVEAYDEIYHVIDQEVDSSRIIDLTQLSGRTEFFHDHVHPTELGAMVISVLVEGSLHPCLNELRSKKASKLDL